MKKLCWIVFMMTCAGTAGILHAAPPATQATQPTAVRLPIPKNETAREAMFRACKVFDLFDVDAAKFGKEASDATVHALGEETDTDLETADFRVDGDSAVVQYRGHPQPDFPMTRIAGVWKVNSHEMLAAMTVEYRKALAQTCAKIRDGVPQLSRDLKTGKIASKDDVIAAARTLGDEWEKLQGEPTK